MCHSSWLSGSRGYQVDAAHWRVARLCFVCAVDGDVIGGQVVVLVGLLSVSSLQMLRVACRQATGDAQPTCLQECDAKEGLRSAKSCGRPRWVIGRCVSGSRFGENKVKWAGCSMRGVDDQVKL